MIGVVTLGVPLVVGLFLASILGWFSFNAGRRRRSIWFVALVVLGSISICALLFSAGGPPWTVDETMRSSKYFEFFLLMVGLISVPTLPVTYFAWSFGRLKEKP